MAKVQFVGSGAVSYLLNDRGEYGSGRGAAAGSIQQRSRPLWWQAAGKSYTASGYGRKIPTSREIYVAGRWRRVYCTIFSNAGTCWIVLNGLAVVVLDYTLRAEGDHNGEV